MRLHRLLSVLTLTAGATLLTAALPTPASAEPYGAVPPTITVSTSAVDEGGLVTFRGDGFMPLELVTIDITYTTDAAASRAVRETGTVGQFVTAALPVPRAIVKTLNAEADGTWVTTIKLTESGTAVITARGTLSNVVAVATVTVLDQTPASGVLARTGLDPQRLSWQVGGGLGAIGAGAGLIWLAVRRRRTVIG